jgi:phosphate:Na+ symporter
MFKPDLSYERADLLASLIEEEDWSASLGETLYQIARRVERQHFSPPGRALVDSLLAEVSDAMTVIAQDGYRSAPGDQPSRSSKLPTLRGQCLKADLPWAERGAILTLLGSAERAFLLIERIRSERQSVLRPAIVEKAVRPPEAAGGIEPVPVPT